MTLKRSLIVKLGTIKFSSSTCSSGESTATVRFLSVAFGAIGWGRKGRGRGKEKYESGFYQVGGSLGLGMFLRTSLNEKLIPIGKIGFARSALAQKLSQF